jgi:hypothetical protein
VEEVLKKRTRNKMIKGQCVEEETQDEGRSGK